MALRIAATASSASCIARLHNPSSLFSQFPFHNLPPRLPHANAFPPLPILKPGSQFCIRAISSETVVEPTISKKEDQEQSPKDWKIKMLYDGDCPLCMREVNMLRERNKTYGTIKFVDIGSDDYSPQEHHGLDYQTAFRRLYEQVGLGWVYAITKYEPIAKIADSVYGVWAKYRLQVTGRPPIEEILEARKKKGEVCKDSKACKM